MRFSCKKCDTQYTIADEKVRGKVIKIRCKRCSNLIVVRSSSPSDLPQSSPEQVAGVLHDSSLEMEFEHAFKEIYDSGLGRPPDEVIDEPAESSSEAGDEVEWYYGLDGAEEGPISFSQMKQHLQAGSISTDHFVWHEGMDDWAPLEDIPELLAVLRRKTPPKPPPPPLLKSKQPVSLVKN